MQKALCQSAQGFFCGQAWHGKAGCAWSVPLAERLVVIAWSQRCRKTVTSVYRPLCQHGMRPVKYPISTEVTYGDELAAIIECAAFQTNRWRGSVHQDPIYRWGRGCTAHRFSHWLRQGGVFGWLSPLGAQNPSPSFCGKRFNPQPPYPQRGSGECGSQHRQSRRGDAQRQWFFACQ